MSLCAGKSCCFMLLSAELMLHSAHWSIFWIHSNTCGINIKTKTPIRKSQSIFPAHTTLFFYHLMHTVRSRQMPSTDSPLYIFDSSRNSPSVNKFVDSKLGIKGPKMPTHFEHLWSSRMKNGLKLKIRIVYRPNKNNFLNGSLSNQ